MWSSHDPLHTLHPWKLRCNPKITQLKRKIIFQTSNFFGFQPLQPLIFRNLDQNKSKVYWCNLIPKIHSSKRRFFETWNSNTPDLWWNLEFFTHMLNYCWWLKSGDHQLRLVVYTFIYKVLYIPGGWEWDFWTINSMEEKLSFPRIPYMKSPLPSPFETASYEISFTLRHIFPLMTLSRFLRKKSTNLTLT